jgi:hypothetical protein
VKYVELSGDEPVIAIPCKFPLVLYIGIHLRLFWIEEVNAGKEFHAFRQRRKPRLGIQKLHMAENAASKQEQN